MNHTKQDGADQSGPSSSSASRASQACSNCRRQKVRCIGGFPCQRCFKSQRTCDFSAAQPQPRAPATANASRLEELENTVATLLATRATSAPAPAVRRPEHGSGGMGISPSRLELSQSSRPDSSFDGGRATFSLPSVADTTASSSSDRSRSVRVHEAQDERPAPTQMGKAAGDNTLRAPGASDAPPGQLRFAPSPEYFQAASVEGTSNSDSPRRSTRVGVGEQPEERLAVVESQGLSEGPFRALAWNPSIWDNAERSHHPSPQPEGDRSVDYDRPFVRDIDDPVNTNLVSEDLAQTLYNFFVRHCHPFLPVVDIAAENAYMFVRKSPPLFSAVIAIASRFYAQYVQRTTNPSQPALDPYIRTRCTHLAEAHLSDTLLRKRHTLSDVQAILLLAAWGLQGDGKGPDAWVMTGHAARLAKRLEAGKRSADEAEVSEAMKLERSMPQLRTRLCWFYIDSFLSLGFGRPQSPVETLDVDALLRIRLLQPPSALPLAAAASQGDVYLSSQAQLSRIARDLVSWGTSDQTATTVILSDLNRRLDEWFKTWIGPANVTAKLQGEHVRLCINSGALKLDSGMDQVMTQGIHKALQSAISTIQTHHYSSETDLALSFATDYITTTLAQAAIFLIRIAKAPQTAVPIDPGVIAHYLRMAVEVLERSDISITRLSSYLAQTVRDISRAAGYPIVEPYNDEAPMTASSSRNGDLLEGLGAAPVGGEGSTGMDLFSSAGWEEFLQMDNDWSFSNLLGLGDETGTDFDLGLW